MGTDGLFACPIPSAAWLPPALRRKAHSFASPPFGGFALSRRKGVAVFDRHAEACPVIATKTDNHVLPMKSSSRFPFWQILVPQLDKKGREVS
jgi:hypothetical protein